MRPDFSLSSSRTVPEVSEQSLSWQSSSVARTISLDWGMCLFAFVADAYANRSRCALARHSESLCIYSRRNAEVSAPLPLPCGNHYRQTVSRVTGYPICLRRRLCFEQSSSARFLGECADFWMPETMPPHHQASYCVISCRLMSERVLSVSRLLAKMRRALISPRRSTSSVSSFRAVLQNAALKRYSRRQ